MHYLCMSRHFTLPKAAGAIARMLHSPQVTVAGFQPFSAADSGLLVALCVARGREEVVTRETQHIRGIRISVRPALTVSPQVCIKIVL